MSGGKKTTTSSNQNSTATTQLPEWMLQAGQANYGAASDYVRSGAMDWTPERAAAYANPFQQQVQANTLREMDRSAASDRAGLNDQVQAAKAFGGTRHAVLEAAQRNDQAQQRADYVDRSNADGYNQARAAFEADRAAKLGSYGALTQILAGTPRNVTTTGTQSGTQTQKQSGSFLDTMLGLGQLGLSAAATFSDPRLKKDVGLIERLASGLGIYRYRYLWERSDQPLHIGVMADEVAAIMPEALGPVVAGFMTVNYPALRGAL